MNLFEHGQGMSGLHPWAAMLAVGPDRKGRKGWRNGGHGCAGQIAPTRLKERLVKSQKKTRCSASRPGTGVRYSAKTSRCLRCLVQTISVLLGG